MSYVVTAIRLFEFSGVSDACNFVDRGNSGSACFGWLG